MNKIVFAALLIAGSIGSATAFAADRETTVDDRLDASAETLGDMMHASDKGIPQDLIDKARCMVVVPGMKKAGFIFGAKYGSGFGFAAMKVAVDGVHRPHCRWKAAASVFRSARRKPTWCCL